MEWQPIETAPKDGTEVLACRAGKKWRQVLGWQWGSGGYDGWYNSGGRSYNPTHWMPIPDLPDLPSIEEMSGSIHPDCEIFETRKDKENG